MPSLRPVLRASGTAPHVLAAATAVPPMSQCCASVSWSPAAGATSYRIRLSKANSKKKFSAWRTVTIPALLAKTLKRKAT
jgi:hypothetical protein